MSEWFCPGGTKPIAIEVPRFILELHGSILSCSAEYPVWAYYPDSMWANMLWEGSEGHWLTSPLHHSDTALPLGL